MSDWDESFLGKYQKFQGNEAEKKSAKLAEERAARERAAEGAAAQPQATDKTGPCVDCGRPISFSAPTCPGCGAADAGEKVLNKKRREEGRRWEEESRRQEEESRRQEEERGRQEEEEARKQAEAAKADREYEERARRRAEAAIVQKRQELRNYWTRKDVQLFLASSQGQNVLESWGIWSPHWNEAYFTESRQEDLKAKFDPWNMPRLNAYFKEQEGQLWLESPEGQLWLMESQEGVEWLASPEGQRHSASIKAKARKLSKKRHLVCVLVYAIFGLLTYFLTKHNSMHADKIYSLKDGRVVQTELAEVEPQMLEHIKKEGLFYGREILFTVLFIGMVLIGESLASGGCLGRFFVGVPFLVAIYVIFFNDDGRARSDEDPLIGGGLIVMALVSTIGVKLTRATINYFVK